MTTYKFCVAPEGTLVCYKINNGFFKFSGNYAEQLLEHIKDFSFYTFNSYIRKENDDKHICDMVFDSNNHRVIFENINDIKNSKSFVVEDEIKDLVNIVYDNNEKEEKVVEIKKYRSMLKKAKAALCAATISASIMLSSKTVKAYTANDIQNPQLKQNEETESFWLQVTHEVPGYDGPILTKSGGVIHNGPAGGDETYYDLNMNRVVGIMRDNGFDEENYPYWVRDDGVKMLGKHVMVAANLEVHPRGTLVPTSLGVGIVCDTGGFAKTNRLKLDIATSWTKGR